MQKKIQELLASGHVTEAARMLERQLLAQPHDVGALTLLARIEASRGNAGQAIGLLRRVLAVAPQEASAWEGMAAIELGRGNADAAEQAYRGALAALPADPAPAYNLALLLQQRGRRGDALELYREALARRPDFPEAHVNLGNLLLETGATDAARRHYQHALAGGAQLAQAHFNLGLIAEGEHDVPAAQACFERALAIDAQYYDAHLGLARLLTEGGPGALAAAAERCERAIRLAPSRPEAYNALGVIRSRQRRFGEAADAFAQAWNKSRGGLPDALRNHVTAALNMRAYERAARACETLLQRDPGDVDALMQSIHIDLQQCRWERLPERLARLRARLDSGAVPTTVAPFAALCIPGLDETDHRRVAEAFSRARVAAALALAPAEAPRGEAARRRLRLGYVSADFHEHATSYLLIGVLEAHDRERFELYGYAIGNTPGGAMGERVRRAFGTFRDLDAQSDLEAAQAIRGDGIDILLDLKGWTKGARPEILAHRPAPLVVNWLGYPGTMGHPAYADYLIGDPIATPPQSAACFTETLALLPHCYQPNDGQRRVGPVPTRADAGLPAHGVVFCSFNQSYKITPQLFDLWCRLLREVDGSVLWLLDDAARPALLREARARGVAGERLVFAPKRPVEEHLGRLALADLALDTAPYNSHTTAADALWAGVPLVGLRGESFAGRVSASILAAAGLPELAAHTPDQYFALALSLATAPERLAEVRARLADLRRRSALFDTPRFTADLESLLAHMWADHLAGRRQAILPNRCP